jgi:hypothetical protein
MRAVGEWVAYFALVSLYALLVAALAKYVF